MARTGTRPGTRPLAICLPKRKISVARTSALGGRAGSPDVPECGARRRRCCRTFRPDAPEEWRCATDRTSRAFHQCRQAAPADDGLSRRDRCPSRGSGLEGARDVLRSLFEVSPVAVLVIDLQGNIRESAISVSPTCCSMSSRTWSAIAISILGTPANRRWPSRVGSMLTDPSVEVFGRAHLPAPGWQACSAARRAPPAGQSGGDDGFRRSSATSGTAPCRGTADRERDEAAGGVHASPAAMIVSDVRRNFASVAANDAWERQFLRRRSR